MKSQSQFLMIALAVSFTMALALTVALICVSYIKDSPNEPPVQETDTETQATAEPSDTTQDTSKDTLPPDQSGGLRFSSNGNGTCRLISIGSCTDACVVIPEYSPAGDRVTEITERAFYNCTTVTAVQIPSSIRSIGELAFAACPNLVYISVSAQNPFFCDMEGILYTADLRTLILYPAMRAGSTLTIRAVTSEIADMAFYNCAYLEHVTYTGTPEDWEEIRIGYKNYSLTAASKSFAS